MIVKEITDALVWQHFFEENGSPSFLQSWEWGELQKKQGSGIIRLGLYEKSCLLGTTLIIKIKSKRGNFLFIPHGPIIMKYEIYNIKHCLFELKKYLIDLGKKENCSFIRVAPIIEDRENNQQLFSQIGFKKAPIYMHAETCWALPLNKTEDELLSQMRKTTRYLIKKAFKEGITIEKRTDNSAVDDFYNIYEETARRENFTPFSKQFIADEFNAFNKTGNTLFLFARLKIPEVVNNYLASALIVFTDSAAFYHQGASIHTKYPASYLMQWEAIREAKKRGCQLYNFWGIFKKGRAPKTWVGLTLFKQGFGGHEINYLPTQDLILSPKYYLTYVYELYLNFKRGV